MGNNGVESTAEVSIEMELDMLEEKILKAAETIEKLRADKDRLQTECERLRGERQETVTRLSRILETVDSLEIL
jgi:FtsZ-binding cell division protein ZapB